MMVRTLASGAALALALTWTSVAGAAVVSSFTFDQLAVGVNNSPADAVGTGAASPIGMTNNLTTPPSVTSADVLINAGSSNPAPTNQAWRIRGAGTGSGNGWHSAAPQYSQGAQFLVSTVGVKDVVLTYDWSPTTQGVKHQQVQYTSDGATWINAGPLQVGPAAEAWINGITINLTPIAAVNNNPLFGIRLVSAYAPDGPNAGQYVNLAGNLLTNTSGNWRLDSVTLTANPIPEPSTALLTAAAAAAVAVRRRARKSSPAN